MSNESVNDYLTYTLKSTVKTLFYEMTNYFSVIF